MRLYKTLYKQQNQSIILCYKNYKNQYYYINIIIMYYLQKRN